MVKSILMQLIKARRSIRRYAEKKIDKKIIMECIEAARLAPSAENQQPWRFIVIDDNDYKKLFSKAAFGGVYSFTKFALKAPVLILILGKPIPVTKYIGNKLQGLPFHIIDCSIAGEHLVLRATELGIGSCWIGWFNIKKVRKFLCIPKSYEIISMLALGYPMKRKDNILKKKRKSIEEIISFNGFEFNE